MLDDTYSIQLCHMYMLSEDGGVIFWGQPNSSAMLRCWDLLPLILLCMHALQVEIAPSICC